MKTRKNQIALSRKDTIAAISTIPQILFRDIPSRGSDSLIIKGQIGRTRIEISLEQLRSLVLFMHSFLPSRNIKKGSTVLLMNMPGAPDIMSTVYFYVFTTFGVKIFMAGKCSTSDFQVWLDKSGADTVILPIDEFTGREGMESDRSLLAAYAAMANNMGLNVLDTIDSFPLYYLLNSGEFKTLRHSENILIDESVGPDEDALVLAAPGRTGTMELVTFKQNGFSFGALESEMENIQTMPKKGMDPALYDLTTLSGIRGLIYGLWNGKAYHAKRKEAFNGGILAEAI